MYRCESAGHVLGSGQVKGEADYRVHTALCEADRRLFAGLALFVSLTLLRGGHEIKAILQNINGRTNCRAHSIGLIEVSALLTAGDGQLGVVSSFRAAPRSDCSSRKSGSCHLPKERYGRSRNRRTFGLPLVRLVSGTACVFPTLGYHWCLGDE